MPGKRRARCPSSGGGAGGPALCAAGLIATTGLAGTAAAGNGAPQGAHDYQLNIIGTNDKNDASGLDAFVVGEEGDADVESDYSVFVRPLGKPGGWATITTCADLLDSTFAGLLGSRQVKTINNAIDPVTGAFCSIEQVGNVISGDLRTFRSAGKTVFSNVTAELLTIVFEVTVDDGGTITTIQVRVPIFNDLLENEYWLYDNNGPRLLQVRFYD